MDTTAAQIEISIAQAKETIALGDALRRLINNADFRAVIREGYFENEAVRLVRLKAAPAMNNERDQTAIIRDIDGIGSLYQYLGALEMQADMAETALEDGEAERSAMSEAGEL